MSGKEMDGSTGTLGRGGGEPDLDQGCVSIYYSRCYLLWWSRRHRPDMQLRRCHHNVRFLSPSNLLPLLEMLQYHVCIAKQREPPSSLDSESLQRLATLPKIHPQLPNISPHRLQQGSRLEPLVAIPLQHHLYPPQRRLIRIRQALQQRAPLYNRRRAIEEVRARAPLPAELPVLQHRPALDHRRHLQEHAAETPHVRRRVRRRERVHLRRGVSRRHALAVLCRLAIAVGAAAPVVGDVEIRQQDVVPAHEDVLRLDVAMSDLAGVEVADGGCEAAEPLSQGRNHVSVSCGAGASEV